MDIEEMKNAAPVEEEVIEQPDLWGGIAQDEVLSMVDANMREKVQSEEWSIIYSWFKENNKAHTYFEKVSRFADQDIPYPIRKTPFSAGYDMAAAEDTIIMPYTTHMETLEKIKSTDGIITLKDLALLTKGSGAKPTLIPTGYKCRILPNQFLALHIRSSSPLKYWLVLANGVGVVDADYYNNSDNEGEIFFQVINLSPFPIKIQKGEIIGQAIVMPYNNLNIDPIQMSPREGGFGSTTQDEASST